MRLLLRPSLTVRCVNLISSVAAAPNDNSVNSSGSIRFIFDWFTQTKLIKIPAHTYPETSISPYFRHFAPAA